MVDINISNVKNFKEFLNKIKYNLDLESSNHTLKIYCLNSELTNGEFEEILLQKYPNSEVVGDFTHTFVTDKEEDINFYCYKEENNPTLFVFSIFGKGKIDLVIEKLIKNLPRTYYFWLPLTMFDQIKEEIIDKHYKEGISIDSFTGLRSPHFNTFCELRPEIERRVEYSGDDGLETLREMKKLYGILPKKISFRVANKFGFSLDQRNTFIINFGLPYLEEIFEIIDISLSRFAGMERVLSEVKFREIILERNVADFEINPLRIKFGDKKNMNQINCFFNQLEERQEGKYCTLNPLVVEGSLFFSATILDIDKKAIFSISGNEDSMSILPQSNCGKEVISRFYEEIDLNLDNHTNLITENAH